jgi:hypothetical protein
MSDLVQEHLLKRSDCIDRSEESLEEEDLRRSNEPIECTLGHCVLKDDFIVFTQRVVQEPRADLQLKELVGRLDIGDRTVTIDSRIKREVFFCICG